MHLEHSNEAIGVEDSIVISLISNSLQSLFQFRSVATDLRQPKETCISRETMHLIH